MANTRQISEIVEPHVRVWLSERYEGRSFHSEQLPIKTGRKNEFDAVSEDREVVAAILSNRARTRTGRSNTGARRKAECDFWRLANLDLPKKTQKLMVFTDADFCHDMQKVIGNPGQLNVKFLVCELPNELESKLAKVLDKASLEQRAHGD